MIAETDPLTCTAFRGTSRLKSGPLADVAAKAKQSLDQDPTQSILIFDDDTGRVLDIDYRGTAEQVVARLQPREQPKQGPGRPKLGVVGREVTLLPRHWEWLESQPGGASVALRKLVEEAKKSGSVKDQIRKSQDAAYRFMAAMVGNEPNFEEAIRLLFRGDREGFQNQMKKWPKDLREHSQKLASSAFLLENEVV
jgi:hypothetical protein